MARSRPDRFGRLRRPHEIRPAWAESDRFVPERFIQPVLAYMRTEASGGVVMLLAAVAAVAWANSPYGDGYTRLWETPLTIDLAGVLLLEHTLQEWVNDALMVLFFFVIGLEIKRELVTGELTDRRAAALPIIAAVGGMVVPALIYLAFNAGTEAARGWGIPMATDIAFAVGVVSLVGTRVPIAAKLFLLTLAVADDIGAILVIALFYTEDLALTWLLAAVAGLAVVVGMQRLEVRTTALYLFVGSWVWLALLESGVHATLAGVTLGLLTPTQAFYRADALAPSARVLVARIEEYAGDPLQDEDPRTIERINVLLRDINRLSRESVAPLERLEHKLAPWSSFLVVPVFAFANAGVRISGDALSGALDDPVLLGVFLGLLVGKFVGVTGATWLAIRAGLAGLPSQATWRHVIGMAMLAGIGFTVALFVTALSFEQPELTDSAKIGIFASSILAGMAGFVWLRTAPELLDAAGSEEA
ncbi:MAG TPA: Na+/H+ antiporter NhaA [Nitriliruptorales bacterium]|nr:Na+/H+ antiporter NhaA [Nitriliruptorales bacterium]